MHKLYSLYKNNTTFFSPFNGSKTAQRLIELFIIMMVVSYAFDGLWRHYLIMRITTGAIGICVLVFSLIAGRLYRYIDVRLLLLFIFIAWISSVINFGLTASYFITRFHCIWMVFLALYMVVYIAPDPSHVMHVFACTSVICFSAICAFITAHGARSLLTNPPGFHINLGCFQSGRLCGLTNANILGFMCTSLLLISVYGFLITKKRLRILYLFSAVLGWFTLGLTGCRTGMLGVSGALGLAIFSSFFLKIGVRKSWSTFLRFIIALAVGILAGVILLLSFYLPMTIFKGLMLGLNMIYHNPHLSQNLANLSIHKLSDDNGTLSSRTFIWAKCIKDSFKTVRRALIGISPLSKDVMVGFIAGHHERTQPHAHNLYLDTIRRFGLLGFAPWIGQIIIWIRYGADILFKDKNDTSDRFLIACVVGFLVMGLAEPVPFSDIIKSFIAIPFFIIIGYCMRRVREKS